MFAWMNMVEVNKSSPWLNCSCINTPRQIQAKLKDLSYLTVKNSQTAILFLVFRHCLAAGGWWGRNISVYLSTYVPILTIFTSSINVNYNATAAYVVSCCEIRSSSAEWMTNWECPRWPHPDYSPQSIVSTPPQDYSVFNIFAISLKLNYQLKDPDRGGKHAEQDRIYRKEEMENKICDFYYKIFKINTK